MEFKDQLRIAREAKGLTPPALAAAMGVSGQAVIWWELGVHEPRTPMLRKLEELLNVRFNLTGSKPLEGTDGAVFGLGKDVVFLAQKIALLPQRHRAALEALIDIGSNVKEGAKSKSFITVEEKTIPKKGFINAVETSSGEEHAAGVRRKKTTKRTSSGSEQRE